MFPTLSQDCDSRVTALARLIFSGQARLLAERAERGLPIDGRSVLNLLRVAIVLLRREESRP